VVSHLSSLRPFFLPIHIFFTFLFFFFISGTLKDFCVVKGEEKLDVWLADDIECMFTSFLFSLPSSPLPLSTIDIGHSNLINENLDSLALSPSHPLTPPLSLPLLSLPLLSLPPLSLPSHFPLTLLSHSS
jgi:hypothetical protein